MQKIVTYNSFSGADITVFLVLPGGGYKEFANLSTISYSSYRDKQTVTPIGQSCIAGVTRGPRTIAGTMVFVVFDKSAFLSVVGKAYGKESISDRMGFVMVDQLPPLDIYIYMTNEYGISAHMSIFGVEFLNEGQIHSIDDLYTENTVNYIARSIIPLKPTDYPLKENNVVDNKGAQGSIQPHDLKSIKEYHKMLIDGVPW